MHTYDSAFAVRGRRAMQKLSWTMEFPWGTYIYTRQSWGHSALAAVVHHGETPSGWTVHVEWLICVLSNYRDPRWLWHGELIQCLICIFIDSIIWHSSTVPPGRGFNFNYFNDVRPQWNTALIEYLLVAALCRKLLNAHTSIIICRSMTRWGIINHHWLATNDDKTGKVGWTIRQWQRYFEEFQIKFLFAKPLFTSMESK